MDNLYPAVNTSNEHKHDHRTIDNQPAVIFGSDDFSWYRNIKYNRVDIFDQPLRSLYRGPSWYSHRRIRPCSEIDLDGSLKPTIDGGPAIIFFGEQNCKHYIFDNMNIKENEDKIPISYKYKNVDVAVI